MIINFITTLNFKLLTANTPTKKREIARWARDEIVNMGPTFVKLGQLASSRSDIFSKEVIDELKELQDNVPPFMDVIPALEKTVSMDMFDSFDVEPLASASLGQCHLARLKDGREVVVKIQRPDVAEVIGDDIENLKYILNIFLFINRNNKNLLEFLEIIDEWKPLILGELDYQKEAERMKQFRDQFEDTKWIKVPDVYMSTENVIIMENVPSVKVSDVEALNKMNADLDELAFYLIKSQYIQITEKGLFHADPHPGNVGLNDQGQIVYYDFGLMMKIEEEYKNRLYNLLDAVYKKDIDRTCQLMIDLGIIIPTQKNRNGSDGLLSIKSFVKLFLNYVESTGIEKLDVEEMKQLENNRPFRLSTMWILLVKSIYTVEGNAKLISNDMTLSKVLTPYAEQVLGDQLNDFLPSLASVTTMPSSIQSIRNTVDSVESMEIKTKQQLESISKKIEIIQIAILILFIFTRFT